MPCDHRFIDDLYPGYPLKYLFVGTFNPSWNAPGNNNANWFYGRRTNDFWYIMPQVFGYDSLMAATFRNDRQFLKDWCEEHKIGITDMFECINDANILFPAHVATITSFKDKGLESFNKVSISSVLHLIENNKTTLQGVYLTRYEHTIPLNGIIEGAWDAIKRRCQDLLIHTHDLVTPSRGYHDLDRNQKIEAWQQVINLG